MRRMNLYCSVLWVFHQISIPTSQIEYQLRWAKPRVSRHMSVWLSLAIENSRDLLRRASGLPRSSPSTPHNPLCKTLISASNFNDLWLENFAEAKPPVRQGPIKLPVSHQHRTTSVLDCSKTHHKMHAPNARFWRGWGLCKPPERHRVVRMLEMRPSCDLV